MPPESRVIVRFAAEPPQEGEPYGRWREKLRGEFLAAAQGLSDAGEIGEITFYPDRTWHGRTFVPASAPTDRGMEIYGFVVFVPAGADGGEPSEFGAHADFTDDTAELANLAVDQCTLQGDRFTLIAPDDYGGDLLEVKLFSKNGEELASESLYDEEDE